MRSWSKLQDGDILYHGLYGEVGSEVAESTAIRLLLPRRLKDQYCFRTESSLASLSFVEVERHDI